MLSLLVAEAEGQMPRGMPRMPRGMGGGRSGGGGMGGARSGGGNDSLKRRDKFEDSISINYRFLDSSRNYSFDTAYMLNDFTSKFPIPPTYTYLGNVGNAARSLLFSPTSKTGWDPGFHAFDIYKWKLENVRFFTTTRPYTELGYVLGSKSQQIIDLIHTQNLKPYWNVALQYRMIYAPGFFQNQKANHNNYLISSWYQAPKKRYNNFAVLLSNKMQSGESGGLADVSLLDSGNFKNRFTIPTQIGEDSRSETNFFSNRLATGNIYNESNFLMRQQYDIGRKDSLVTDSTVIPLFYPRLRFEHTFKTGKYNYRFQDQVADSVYYDSLYNYKFRSQDSVSIKDNWREISNDFSIYQFPDEKNLNQFIKLGIEYQLLKGTFENRRTSKSFYNFIGHAEYRNRTRNQKWDIQSYGRLHLNGFNVGDYHAYISLQRMLSKTLGSLQLGFENTNRSPSFIYNNQSSFYLDNPPKSFSKENTLHFFGVSNVPKLRLQLTADYYLVSNYLYLKNYYQLQQESALFNFLKISASKKFILNKRWNLYSDVWIQQKAGSAEINTPLFYTRQRLAFEGVFFKNLNLSTGLELRYHTPYKADDYSPVLGSFFYQDSVTISNTPQVDLFMHFRIRSFKAYIRVENLNTLQFTKENGLSFTNNNLAAPNYAYPGMVIRFGLYWSFVN